MAHPPLAPTWGGLMGGIQKQIIKYGLQSVFLNRHQLFPTPLGPRLWARIFAIMGGGFGDGGLKTLALFPTFLHFTRLKQKKKWGLGAGFVLIGGRADG